MGSLSADARGVVEGARSSLRPTVADRDRIEAALRTRLGSSALLSNTVAPPRGAAIAGRFATSAAIGVCVLGGALFFALHARPTSVTGIDIGDAQPKVATRATVSESSAPSEPSSTALAAATPSLAAATPPLLPVLSTVRRRDRLTREVALLTRATSALGAGRPGDALKALNEHQRQFPNGILSEERRAAKAQALCSLGRVSAGRAELARLTPGSLAATRARQVCDSDSALGEQAKR